MTPTDSVTRRLPAGEPPAGDHQAPADPVAPLRSARRRVDTARARYSRANATAATAVGHLLRVFPGFSRADLRREAGGTRRLHYRLMEAHTAGGDEEIPLWEITDEERQAAYAAAVAAVQALLAAKSELDGEIAARQDAVLAVRAATRSTLPLVALAEPAGLSYQWLMKLDHR